MIKKEKEMVIDSKIVTEEQANHFCLNEVLKSLLIKKSLFSNPDIAPSVNGEPLLRPGLFVINSSKEGTLFKGTIEPNKINPVFGLSKGMSFKLNKLTYPKNLYFTAFKLLITDVEKTISYNLPYKDIEYFSYQGCDNLDILVSMLFLTDSQSDEKIDMLLTGTTIKE